MRMVRATIALVIVLFLAPLAHADLSAMLLSTAQNTSRFNITRNTGTNFAFSANHLTATALTSAPSGSDFSAFTTGFHSDVKRFFRFTVGTAAACGQGVGVASSTEINGAYLGHGGSNSFGIFNDGSTSINNTSIGNTGISFASGDVIDLIIDPNAKTVQEVKNGGSPSGAISIASLSTQNVSPAISLCATNDSMIYNGNPSVSYSGAVAWDAPAPPAGGGIAVVRAITSHSSTTHSGNTVTWNLPAPIGAGDTVVGYSHQSHLTPVSITDDVGNSYNLTSDAVWQPYDEPIAMWYKVGVTGNPTKINITFADSSITFCDCAFVEYSGATAVDAIFSPVAVDALNPSMTMSPSAASSLLWVFSATDTEDSHPCQDGGNGNMISPGGYSVLVDDCVADGIGVLGSPGTVGPGSITFTWQNTYWNASQCSDGSSSDGTGCTTVMMGASIHGSPGGPPPPATFVANFSDVHQTIDGFGASDAYEGISTGMLDRLFCVNATDPGCSAAGIGLSLLREGMDSQDGVNQHDSVTSSSPSALSSHDVAVAAKARGVTLFATPWTVSLSDYNASANGIVAWVQAQAAASIPVYGVMTQNEPDCACNNGNAWNPSQTASFADVLGPKLHALSPPVKMLSPETAFPPNDFNNFVSAIESDSTANAQTDIFSTHEYGNIIGITNDGSRHIWETEVFDGGSWDPSIADAVNQLQSMMYDSFVTSGVSAWNYWNLVCGSGCNNFGLTGNFSDGLSEIPKRYYAMGNWSRYVRPGWVRIGVSGSLGGIYPVAFKDPISGKFAIIAINNSGSDIQNVSFGVSGATITGSVTPYITSGTPQGLPGSDGNLSAGSASSNVPASLPVSGGVWTATVPYGVTTFVGGP